jgi:hypothetical protein
MSITRLQQARQMYAMGQRVGRIAFGGGGTMGASDQGYQGGGQGGYGDAGKSGPSNDGPDNNGNNKGGGADPMPSTPVTETFPTNLTGGITVSTNPFDLKEQYRLGNIPTKTGVVTFNNPYVSNALETQRKNNTIDALNLAGETYQGINVPFGVPGGMIINTVGNFLGGLGFNKNKNFFAENVAGKYGYGYGLKDYQQYMADRTSGKVGAYGNENMGQNAINERAGDSSREGIMSAYNNNQDYGDEDGDGDVDNDDFIFKYFDKTGETLQAGAGGVQDLMSSIRERISNIFS